MAVSPLKQACRCWKFVAWFADRGVGWDVLACAHGGAYRKQPCRCGHGKSIHHPDRNSRGKLKNPCNFPGCKCSDYRFVPAEKAP